MRRKSPPSARTRYTRAILSWQGRTVSGTTSSSTTSSGLQVGPVPSRPELVSNAAVQTQRMTRKSLRLSLRRLLKGDQRRRGAPRPHRLPSLLLKPALYLKAAS